MDMLTGLMADGLGSSVTTVLAKVVMWPSGCRRATGGPPGGTDRTLAARWSLREANPAILVRVPET